MNKQSKSISFILIALIILCVFTMMNSTACETKARDIAEQTQKQISDIAISSVSIPNVSYFQERRTIAKWAERWDKPNLPCFLYLYSYGVCIGYIVTDGKPASTRSYLMPEESLASSYNNESSVLSQPDIDGTYGENNPGIRFFTAEGVAGEWSGYGACALYFDAPLQLSVPKLNPIVKK